jgi:hypothetical protein
VLYGGRERRWRTNQGLQETQGIRMSRLGRAGTAGADQVDLERAVRYWVQRHAVLKPRRPVPNRRGSNQCPGDWGYSGWNKTGDSSQNRKQNGGRGKCDDAKPFEA